MIQIISWRTRGKLGRASYPRFPFFFFFFGWEKRPGPIFRTYGVSWTLLLGRRILEISIITLIIIEYRALWLARSFALSRYNHRSVIITLKASSSQYNSQIFWCLGVGNRSILLFSRIITKMNVIILKQLGASGDVNIGEWSPRLRLGDYSPIFTSPLATHC